MFSLKGHRCYNTKQYNIIFHGLKTWSCWIAQRIGPPREKYYTPNLLSILNGFIRCDADLTNTPFGWFTSTFCCLTWRQNLSPVLVDYFGMCCRCLVLWLVSVLNLFHLGGKYIYVCQYCCLLWIGQRLQDWANRLLLLPHLFLASS